MRKTPKLALKITKSLPSNSLIPTSESLISGHSSLAQINDQIYIGSYEDACDYLKLRENQITDIINCSPFNCPNTFKEDFNYFNFELCDSQDFDLWDPMNAIIKLIQELKSDGRKILIHCYQGISRAPSIAIGYLIQCEDRNVDDAIKHVKSTYMKADPNVGFMIQLEEYYKVIHSKRGSL